MLLAIEIYLESFFPKISKGPIKKKGENWKRLLTIGVLLICNQDMDIIIRDLKCGKIYIKKMV